MINKKLGFLIEKKGIEIGHIFYLGTKYSSVMGALFDSNNNNSTEINQIHKEPIEMGCYGIGVTRVIAGIL